MADITYRANLKSTYYPMLSELLGRTVIVRGQDQNAVPNVTTKEDFDASAGIPQILYAHNVIPTTEGFRSVTYTEYAAAQFPAGSAPSRVFTIRDGAGNTAHLVMTASGALFTMDTGTSSWDTPIGAPTPTDIASTRITTAFISGVTYIYFSNYGCYSLDITTNTLTPVTLTGLDPTEITGILAHRGYLLAHSDTELSWSSTIDPTDFTPSEETGAGGGAIEGLLGTVVKVQELFGGFVIFSTGGAISVVSSDNINYPFTLSPLPGAGGLIDPDFVTADPGTGSIYAYTTSGLQAVSIRQATLVFPEVTDFISGSRFEDFDENFLTFSFTETNGAPIRKRLSLVSNRYILLSYGVSSLTHCLYYDISLKLWGKLRLTHADVFELEIYQPGLQETQKKSIAFLSDTGRITVLNSDIDEDRSGVVVLGRYQYVRSRLLQLQQVEIENLKSTHTVDVYDLPSLNGKTFLPALNGYLVETADQSRKYNFHNTALNHAILLKGSFNAVTLVLNFNVAGSR